MYERISICLDISPTHRAHAGLAVVMQRCHDVVLLVQLGGDARRVHLQTECVTAQDPVNTHAHVHV